MYREIYLTDRQEMKGKGNPPQVSGMIHKLVQE